MKIKGLLIDVKNNNVEVKEVEKILESYYEILDCDCIDIVTRRFGDRSYDIVCDDEALLSGKPIVSAYDTNGNQMLFGNLFIVKFDGADDITPLEDEDIEYLKKYITNLPVLKKDATSIKVLRGVSY